MKRLRFAFLAGLAALAVACAPTSAATPSRAPGAGAAPPAQQVKLDATPLVQGHPIERAIRGGEVQRYSVTLAAGEVVLGTVDQRGVDVVLTLIDAQGVKIREVDVGGAQGPEPVQIEASTAGTYFIEVKAFELPRPDGAPASSTPPPSAEPMGTYEARIDERLTAAAYAARQARLAIPSKRLFHVWEETQAGHADALERFFAEYKDHAPLVEPIDGDAEQVLVTIVARADPKKPYLGVGWIPYAEESAMSQLPGLPAWYFSMKMPRDSRFLYSLVDAPRPPSGFDELLAKKPRYDTLSADPFAKTTLGSQTVVVLPGAPAQPWVERKDGVPEGRIQRLKVKTTRLPEERTLGVYTPASYDASRTYPLVVVFDGEVYGLEANQQLIPLPRILDNLIAAKKIPPTVAVFIDQQGFRNRDLTMSDAFADFVALEVVPKLRREFHAGSTPRETVVTGSSYGGLCSAFVGLKHSEVVGNVLSQSGAFGYYPRREEVDATLTTERDVLITAYVKAKQLPLHFYLDAGRFESSLYGGILGSNRHLRDVLLAKGYPLKYVEFNGNHDYASWRGTISEGLMALLPAPK